MKGLNMPAVTAIEAGIRGMDGRERGKAAVVDGPAGMIRPGGVSNQGKRWKRLNELLTVAWPAVPRHGIEASALESLPATNRYDMDKRPPPWARESGRGAHALVMIDP